MFCVMVASLNVAATLASAQTVKDGRLTVRPVASGLHAPTTMAFIGPDDILVLQKNDGRVRRILGGVLQPGEVLDVAVDYAAERGLLGIAVHPQFPTTPFVYLFYTESSTGADTEGFPPPLGNRLYRYTWNGTALINPTLLLDLSVSPNFNHNGGVLTFGPDGKLYAVIGDLDHRGQLQNLPAGPLPDDTGVIFRLNDDGTIPGDNPFFSQGGKLAQYYAYGIRNSFGLAFDPVTGNLWDTENGAATYDEINLVRPGFNSGWIQIMGPNVRDPQRVDDLFHVPGSHYADPAFSWRRTVAPTGIVFLDSPRLGEQYLNDAFVGDYVTGSLYRFRMNATRDGFLFRHPGLVDRVADTPGELRELIFGTGFGAITDLEVGPDGLLYVLPFERGTLYVIAPRAPDP
ncbi:MAG: PQQ-dependent sugar dehydrogenase [Candidatus Rokubacteria bacterium]|nr:PQQ-dependent sugar dehydrogenase [Candidatus Rokubacteria bacterium]